LLYLFTVIGYICLERKKIMQYGKTLKLIRDKKQYTLEYVARQSGISTDILTEIENQSETPDSELLTKLSDLYEVPVHIIEHLSDDQNINGDTDEQRRKDIKDNVIYALYLEDNFDFNQVVDDLGELRELKIKREGLKVG